MTAPRSPDRGAADTAALVTALVLVSLALAPALLLRAGEGWRRCAGDALLENRARTRTGDPRVPAAIAAAERVLAAGSPAFVPDPSRRLGPPPAEAAAPVPAPPGAAGRVTDLSGRVLEGRLSLRWTPAPGSRATALRIEGLGGPGPLEREVPADVPSLDLPVPGTAGTVVVRASPVGLGTPAPEARVSVPYRIAVEVVRAERVLDGPGSAILRLRRPYDGRNVEADFSLHEADPVGNLSPVSPGGPEVDFRTSLVLEDVRDLTAPGPFIEVPLFGSEGRVRRDAEGRVLTYGRASTVDAGQEVVLRGPDDERRVIPVR